MTHHQPVSIRQAFILGAGLGTRLRPLTETVPKPLVPVFHEPLIHYVMDHLLAAGVEQFFINTHHCPGAYQREFPEARYRGRTLKFLHENILLDTGGGLRNAADHMADQPFLVYNGDQLTDVPLAPLLDAGGNENWEVTLLLRSDGPKAHVRWEPSSGLIRDIRGQLGASPGIDCQFCGIYLVRPAFARGIEAGRSVSVIPHFMDLIKEEKLGGVLVDEGEWWDLGTVQDYLESHRILATDSLFPRYASDQTAFRQAVHETAHVGPGAQLLGGSVAGAGSVVGDRAVLENCILWPGSRVEPESRLIRAVVRGGEIGGEHHDCVI